MRASFHFLPSDLTEQRVSGFEQLLLLWEWVGPCLLQLIGIRAGPLHGRGKRNWEDILAEFFERDLGKTVAIENVRDGVAHIEQEGGRPLYSSSARGTFCLAGRALKAARRAWLPACRIPMLLRGLGNSANRTDTSARRFRITGRRVLRAARGVGMLACRLRSAARASFDLASRHGTAARRDQLLVAHIRCLARRTRRAMSGPFLAVFSASKPAWRNKKGVPLARNAFVHGAVSGPQAEAASGG